MINLCENEKVKKSKNDFESVFVRTYTNKDQQFLFIGYGCEGTEETIDLNEVLFAYVININEVEEFAKIDMSELDQFYHIPKTILNTEKPWKQDWMLVQGGIKSYDRVTLMNKYRALLQKIKLLNTKSFVPLLKEWYSEYPTGQYNAETALHAQILDSFFYRYDYVLLAEDEDLRNIYKKYLDRKEKFIKLREEHKKNKADGVVTV